MTEGPAQSGTSNPGAMGAGPIGPEPSGVTPIDDEDLAGLIPDFVATRADLNQVEFENITKALPWGYRRAEAAGPEGILSYGFMLDLHRHMFGDVWVWAGTLRQKVTNIGVDPSEIVMQSGLLFDDARFWHRESVFSADELAARIHGRLVSVHPFPNGNGRSTRLMADLYLIAVGSPPFTWGGSHLDEEDAGRAAYIRALVLAVETDDYSELIRFARG
jgi:Fic-DOC domain mobile mystery protein B